MRPRPLTKCNICCAAIKYIYKINKGHDLCRGKCKKETNSITNTGEWTNEFSRMTSSSIATGASHKCNKPYENPYMYEYLASKIADRQREVDLIRDPDVTGTIVEVGPKS